MSNIIQNALISKRILFNNFSKKVSILFLYFTKNGIGKIKDNIYRASNGPLIILYFLM